MNHSDDPDIIFNHVRVPTFLETTPQLHNGAIFRIAVVWANKYDLRTFLLFPEVFHAGCTCDRRPSTNNTINNNPPPHQQ
jgi:hypothetical protein